MNIISNCEYCGEPIDWYEKSELFHKEHKKCFRVMHFEKLSIFDKYFKFNTFENSNPANDTEKEFMESFKKYCNNFEAAKEKGVGIGLFGSAGTGKTFYANCISNALKLKKIAVLSFNLSGYFSEIRKGFDAKENELLEAVKLADFIIIDDVGNESLTDWTKEKLFNLFNTIYLNKKSICFTTNMKPKQLKDHFSDKIFDRLLELCKGFTFDWESRRKQIGVENFKDIF